MKCVKISIEQNGKPKKKKKGHHMHCYLHIVDRMYNVIAQFMRLNFVKLLLKELVLISNLSICQWAWPSFNIVLKNIWV